MKAVEVNYSLTFNDNFFREKNKLKDVKDVLKNAFEKMIEHVKKDFRPGDIMRAAIYNEALDFRQLCFDRCPRHTCNRLWWYDSFCTLYVGLHPSRSILHIPPLFLSLPS